MYYNLLGVCGPSWQSFAVGYSVPTCIPSLIKALISTPLWRCCVILGVELIVVGRYGIFIAIYSVLFYQAHAYHVERNLQKGPIFCSWWPT